MKIGELALVAQCTVETVRYYEKAGLLPETARTAGNFRVYEPGHVERLRFIRNCRALDMSQQEIHTLLALAAHPQTSCGAVNAVLDQHITHVNQRMEELDKLRRQLQALRELCQNEQAVDSCGILQGLVAMETTAKPERLTHLG
jgi:Cd(II)/Pb(II)-responsive transcriptional regulator